MSAGDYKAEADENLRLALTSMNGYQHLTTADLIALAQVNSTLELAEQQRIANLIAFLLSVQSDYNEGSLTKELMDRVDSASAQVLEGLGL